MVAKLPTKMKHVILKLFEDASMLVFCACTYQASQGGVVYAKVGNNSVNPVLYISCAKHC